MGTLWHKSCLNSGMRTIPSICVLAVAALAGCRSRAPSATAPSKQELPQGEVEVVVFCSGPEFQTNAEAIRANAVGESIDMNVAKRKAMSNVRLELASAIETTVRGVDETYTNSRENDNNEQIEERYESFSRQVVNQQLRGIRTICERYTRTPEGKYKAYVAVELSAQHLVEAYYQRLAERGEASGEDDYTKVRDAFEQEMKADNSQ